MPDLLCDDPYFIACVVNGYTNEDLYKQWNGTSLRTIQRYAKEVRDRSEPKVLLNSNITPLSTNDKPVETREETKDTLCLSKVSRIKTLEGLMEAFEVDDETWEVEKWVANKWEVGAKNADGQLETEPLYQVKAWFKRKVKSETEARINALVEAAKTYMPPARVWQKPIIRDCHRVLEVSIFDAHLGKLARGKETGFGDYDLNIAVERYHEAVNQLVSGALPFGFEKILFVMGQDFMNSDNRAGTTEKGTPQDNDTRYHKVFETACRTLIAAVDKFTEYAPVEVLSISGNHDKLASWHLARELDLWYSHNDAVTVDAGPEAFKVWEYGQNLVGFCHGDGGKRKDYPLDLAVQFPQAWGRTSFREIHTGHLHQNRVEETKGVNVRILPSLTEPDIWHAENRFVGNLRSAKAFVWHKERGPITEHTYHVPVV